MNLRNSNFIELQNFEKILKSKHEKFRAASLNLDLTRGKPSKEQLDLSDGMFNLPKNLMAIDGNSDLRNYGGLDGIKAARKLGSEILGIHESEVIAGDHSSLTLMYLYVLHAFYHGVQGTETAWIVISSPSTSIDANTKLSFVTSNFDSSIIFSRVLSIEINS